MRALIEVPGLHELQDAPETAVLGLVEHALLVASTSLMVEHPAIGRIGECYEGQMPGRQVLLAQLVCDRCAELSELLRWYRRSCERVLTEDAARRHRFCSNECELAWLLKNSNRESGNPADVPSGNRQGTQGRGPE